MPHTPGSHCPGHRAPTRRTRRQHLTAGRVTALLLLAPAIGLFFGGTVFAVLCAAAASLATLRVRPAGLWWVLPLAPVAIWTVCVGHQMYDASWGTTKQAVAVARGMIDAFPAMVVTLVATAAAALLRGAVRRRSARA